MRSARMAALMVQTNALFITHRKRIVELTAKSGIPAVYGERQFVDAGGLMFYGAGLRDMYSDAAVYADKIIRGAKPAELPVELATKFELVVNAKTARVVGLAIPETFRVHADEVIE